jgi:hypothetical protein
MTLTEGFKVARAEAYQSILMRNHDTPDLSQFHQFHESIEVLALVVETTTNIREPFIHLDALSLTRGSDRLLLIEQIRLLSNAGYSDVGNGEALFLCFHSPILKVLIMGLVTPLRGRAMGYEYPLRSHFCQVLVVRPSNFPNSFGV